MASSGFHEAFSQYNQSVAKEEENKNVYLINYVLDHNGSGGSSTCHCGAAGSFIDCTDS